MQLEKHFGIIYASAVACSMLKLASNEQDSDSIACKVRIDIIDY